MKCRPKIALAMALGILSVTGAHADPSWWILDSQSGSCQPASVAVRITHDPSMSSPFSLAAKMRDLGRLNKETEQVRTATGSAYGVFYDGVVTAFFVNKETCQSFLNVARKSGDLPG